MAHHTQPNANVPATIEEFSGSIDNAFPGAGLPSVVQFGEGRKDQPAVIVFHEITGPTREALALAEQISRHGYTVYLPVLFGEPGRRSNGTLSILLRCLGPNYRCLFPGSSRIRLPAARVLKAVATRHSEAKVGLIGMCLTGSLPLELLVNDRVEAAVLSQPALPLFPARSVGIGRRRMLRINQAIAARKLEVLTLHFTRDCLSPPKRIAWLAATLPAGALTAIPYESSGPEHHSVLTDSVDFAPKAVAETIRYLDAQLKRQARP